MWKKAAVSDTSTNTIQCLNEGTLQVSLDDIGSFFLTTHSQGLDKKTISSFETNYNNEGGAFVSEYS